MYKNHINRKLYTSKWPKIGIFCRFERIFARINTFLRVLWLNADMLYYWFTANKSHKRGRAIYAGQKQAIKMWFNIYICAQPPLALVWKFKYSILWPKTLSFVFVNVNYAFKFVNVKISNFRALFGLESLTKLSRPCNSHEGRKRQKVLYS